MLREWRECLDLTRLFLFQTKVWDSGFVTSKVSRAVLAPEYPLSERTTYVWRVQWADSNGMGLALLRMYDHRLPYV